MPVRFLGDDGHCAIDITLRRGTDDDVSDWRTISTHARAILDECVDGRGQDGEVRNFSKCEWPNGPHASSSMVTRTSHNLLHEKSLPHFHDGDFCIVLELDH